LFMAVPIDRSFHRGGHYRDFMRMLAMICKG
jgi:hypothetical protein